jgi:hypothetical protein
MGRNPAAPAVVVIVIGLVIAGCVWLLSVRLAAPRADVQPMPVTEQPSPLPAPDGPPNHADNRGYFQPSDLTEEQERALTEEAARMRPALVALSTEDRLSPDAVRAVLVGLGYPDSEISTEFRPDEYSGLHQDRVVVGVSFPDSGCVSGGVWADEVRLLPVGRIREWGCTPPDTH